VLAAHTLFAGEQSINREFFSLATQRSGELALTNWRCCLEADEARAADERACEIEVADGEDAEETDAAELLVGLDGG